MSVVEFVQTGDAIVNKVLAGLVDNTEREGGQPSPATSQSRRGECLEVAARHLPATTGQGEVGFVLTEGVYYYNYNTDC